MVLSAVFFARHVSDLVKVTSVVDPDNVERLYAVTGELFFASTHDIVHSFDYDAVRVKRVEIDLTDARIWDTSAVAALDTVVSKYSDHLPLYRQSAILERETGVEISRATLDSILAAAEEYRPLARRAARQVPSPACGRGLG